MSMAFMSATEQTQLQEMVEYTIGLLEDAGSLSTLASSDNLLSIVLALIDYLPAYLSQPDGEGVINSLVTLTFSQQFSKNQDVIVAKFNKVLSSSQLIEYNAACIQVMSKLFNGLPPRSHLRYDTFLSLVALTSRSSAFETLTAQLGQLPSWLSEWSTTLAEQQALYKAINQVLLDKKQDKLACDCLAGFLKTLNGKPANQLAAFKADALLLLSQVVATESLLEYDTVLSLDVVSQLKGEKLHEIVGILSRGTLTDFLAWQTANAGVVAALKLDEERLTHKMRLATLAQLCARDHVVEFHAISAALQIPAAQIELWVIDAVRTGLVEAKIDEMNNRIIVSRSTLTAFGMDQWKDLKVRRCMIYSCALSYPFQLWIPEGQARLEEWKSNIADVKKVLVSVKAQIDTRRI
eukprot:m.132030 g.132030  ORF g.132030 m.132030 type:complete len:408 (+) comp52373_c0_seq9:281-1504(+)